MPETFHKRFSIFVFLHEVSMELSYFIKKTPFGLFPFPISSIMFHVFGLQQMVNFWLAMWSIIVTTEKKWTIKWAFPVFVVS